MKRVVCVAPILIGAVLILAGCNGSQEVSNPTATPAATATTSTPTPSPVVQAECPEPTACPAPITCPTCPEPITCPTCPEPVVCPGCPTCPTCPEPVVCPECPACPPPTCPQLDLHSACMEVSQLGGPYITAAEIYEWCMLCGGPDKWFFAEGMIGCR
jgi:hypothetical protein